MFSSAFGAGPFRAEFSLAPTKTQDQWVGGWVGEGAGPNHPHPSSDLDPFCHHVQDRLYRTDTPSEAPLQLQRRHKQTTYPLVVAVSHCITWLQTQLILTLCQIRYHSHCGIIVALDSSEPRSRGVTSSAVK